MAQIKILAVEDNPIHAAKLEMLLDELGYFLIDVESDVRNVLSKAGATQPDLILLDIDLKQAEDGIDLAEKINRQQPVPIIFTTSFADRATLDRAKMTHPYAYLIKPLEKAALQAGIELAVFRFANRGEEASPLPEPNKDWTQHTMTKDSFFVKTNCLEKVRYNDIRWVGVASDRYCEIVTADKTYTIRTSLKNLEAKLPEQQFVRVHKSFIVNIQKVVNIIEQDMLIKLDDQYVPMGASYRQHLLKYLNVL